MNSSKNSSNNLFTSINLSDYNSIKTGTYGKLLKAYYKKADTEDIKESVSKKPAISKINESASESNKSNLYAGDGSYSNLTTGDLFNSIV